MPFYLSGLERGRWKFEAAQRVAVLAKAQRGRARLGSPPASSATPTHGLRVDHRAPRIR
jgi:hypothetical protein